MKANNQKRTEIYLNSLDNNYRYALGTKGEKTLYCFGLNPSTATLTEDDPTIIKVKSAAQKNGFENVIMLNIYPQRATNPDNLDCNINTIEHKFNLQKIISIIEDNSTVWAAWGNSIGKRPYLSNCLNEIKQKLETKNAHWVKMGELTKKGNPRHPLYLKCQKFSEYENDNAKFIKY